MNSWFKIGLAVVGGLIIGSVVNMGLIYLGHAIIPNPPGADVSTMEGLKNSIHLFQPRHFLFPFLAHAGGTFVGALFAARLAPVKKTWVALVIGFFFLLGGMINVVSLPAPWWFEVPDVVLAYLPVSIIAGRLMGGECLLPGKK